MFTYFVIQALDLSNCEPGNIVLIQEPVQDNSRFRESSRLR